MANIVNEIDDQACRMRGRAVQFDGKSNHEKASVPELLDRAELNLHRARLKWMTRDEDEGVNDMVDVCNLLALAVDKIERRK